MAQGYALRKNADKVSVTCPGAGQNFEFSGCALPEGDFYVPPRSYHPPNQATGVAANTPIEFRIVQLDGPPKVDASKKIVLTPNNGSPLTIKASACTMSSWPLKWPAAGARATEYTPTSRQRACPYDQLVNIPALPVTTHRAQKHENHTSMRMRLSLCMWLQALPCGRLDGSDVIAQASLRGNQRKGIRLLQLQASPNQPAVLCGPSVDRLLGRCAAT